ncbi:MAG: hypothetical protein R2751_13085 [Bacteroidales bacterium]
MGYPINTTDDDLFFTPDDNGKGAYYSLYTPKGVGRHDIYYLNIYSVDNPRMYLVSGRMSAEGAGDPGRFALYVVDAETGDTVLVNRPATGTGKFSFELAAGNYNILFRGPGYEDLIQPLEIGSLADRNGVNLGNGISLEKEYKEKQVYEGEESMIRIQDSLLVTEAGGKAEVTVRGVRGKELIVKTFRNDSLVSVDTVEADRRRMQLELEALPGDSRVEVGPGTKRATPTARP